VSNGDARANHYLLWPQKLEGVAKSTAKTPVLSEISLKSATVPLVHFTLTLRQAHSNPGSLSLSNEIRPFSLESQKSGLN